MRFLETDLQGLVVVEPDTYPDERGSFVRTFDAAEWEAHGLRARFAQSSFARNLHRGTLRGMHYQDAPHAEAKAVRCSRGAIFDVALDLRPRSATFRRWFGLELNEDNATMLYLPEGFAHGYLTLTEVSEVAYLISEPYVPKLARGVRWDDPAFAIEWPAAPQLMSERDRDFPEFGG